MMYTINCSILFDEMGFSYIERTRYPMFLFTILGILLVGLACIPLFQYHVVHIGVYFMLFLGILFCVIGLCHNKIRQIGGKHYHWIRNSMIIVGLLVVILMVSVTTWMVYAAFGNTPSSEEDRAVVVLGCQVKGTKEDYYPSLMLQRRLDTAVEYLNENQKVYCIVSGGKGDNEPVSESQCMKDYLIENGISSDRIFEENQSRNTAENLKYSKELLDRENLGSDVVIITDGFHQLRAKLYAEAQQMTVKGISSDTPFGLAVSYYVREWFALLKYFVLGN